jgi:TRAP transporter TAXI family solute receptor
MTKLNLLKLAVASALLSSTLANAKEVVVNTVSPTSDDYALSVSWANITARENNGLQMTVVDNGTVKGLRKLANGQVDVTIIGAPHYLDAVSKKGKFKADPERFIDAYKHMKSLFSITTSAGQYVVSQDSNISNFEQLEGKSLAIGRPGGNAGRVTDALLSAYGLDMKKGDVDGQYLGYNAAFDQMSNGSLDGTFVWGGLPQAAIDNTSRTMKLRFISPSPDKMSAFRSDITNGLYYVLKSVPKEAIDKAYDGRVESDPVNYFWTFPMMFVVNDSMPNDEAYELTRSLWDNLPQINKTSLALSLVRFDEATEGLSATMHPGAARYFKEKGLLK